MALGVASACARTRRRSAKDPSLKQRDKRPHALLTRAFPAPSRSHHRVPCGPCLAIGLCSRQHRRVHRHRCGCLAQVWPTQHCRQHDPCMAAERGETQQTDGPPALWTEGGSRVVVGGKAACHVQASLLRSIKYLPGLNWIHNQGLIALAARQSAGEGRHSAAPGFAESGRKQMQMPYPHVGIIVGEAWDRDDLHCSLMEAARSCLPCATVQGKFQSGFLPWH